MTGLEVYKTTQGEWIAETVNGDQFKFSDWDNRIKDAKPEPQLFQWLLYIASKMYYKNSALEIVEFALANFLEMR